MNSILLKFVCPYCGNKETSETYDKIDDNVLIFKKVVVTLKPKLLCLACNKQFVVNITTYFGIETADIT